MVSDFLPADLQQFVAQEVADGKYPSPDAVFTAAVKLLRDRDQEMYERFRTELRIRIERADRGELIQLDGEEQLRGFFDDVAREVDAELAAERAANP